MLHPVSIHVHGTYPGPIVFPRRGGHRRRGDRRFVRTRRQRGGVVCAAWQGPAPAGAARVLGRIRVRPDAFYERFFDELLGQTPADDPARPLLEEALARASTNPFDLWSREESLSK